MTNNLIYEIINSWYLMVGNTLRIINT